MRIEDETPQGDRIPYTPPEIIKTFVDDKRVLNLEIGAGRGNFGKIFYRECYLVDNNSELFRLGENHHLDLQCDAHALPWSPDRFQHVIICNPFGYGFQNNDSTAILMSEMIRVTRNDGRIIVLGHTNNKYSAQVKKRVTAYQTISELNLEVLEERIDPSVLYPNHVFRQCSGLETVPNLKFTIHVTKS